MRPTALALALILTAGQPSGRAAAAEDLYPRAATAYAVAINGRLIWARAADTARPPASLTKIMTALIVLEGDWHPDADVSVSASAAGAKGRRLGLRAGERISALDALTAMLLGSANDACLALAEHGTGSESRFVARMNERARALGLAKTRFSNACGHDAPDHKSSAADLLRLSEHALGLPEFARIVAMRGAEASTRGGRRFRLMNSNALIGRLPGAAGVKTGFTSRAGKCLAAHATREGVRVTAVLLDAPDRWWSAAGLLEAAFDAAGRAR